MDGALNTRTPLFKMNNGKKEEIELVEADNEGFVPDSDQELITGGEKSEKNIGKEKKSVNFKEGNLQNEVKVEMSISVSDNNDEVPSSSKCEPEFCIEVKKTVLQMNEDNRVFDPYLKIKMRMFYIIIVVFIIWGLIHFNCALK